MRVIDAEPIIERLKNAIYLGKRIDEDTANLEAVLEDIEAQPTAEPEIIRCKDCVNHVDDRCLVANHHTGDNEYCTEVFGAKRKGEQP